MGQVAYLAAFILADASFLSVIHQFSNAMFTGIIEASGQVTDIRSEEGNLHFDIASSISSELKIDQSVSHNGVCLTVVALNGNMHTVTAIGETLARTNLKTLRKGDAVNLERAMQANARLDGHMVQGHIDITGTCTEISDKNGSWIYTIEYPFKAEYLLVDKGSICVNGVSLTVVKPKERPDGMAEFSVAIIPYTFEHTNFKSLQAGDQVNLEFDVIGKYVGKYLSLYTKK